MARWAVSNRNDEALVRAVQRPTLVESTNLKMLTSAATDCSHKPPTTKSSARRRTTAQNDAAKSTAMTAEQAATTKQHTATDYRCARTEQHVYGVRRYGQAGMQGLWGSLELPHKTQRTRACRCMPQDPTDWIKLTRGLPSLYYDGPSTTGGSCAKALGE